MARSNTIWPSNRQLLAVIGNRYVVFGLPQSLPGEPHFDPFKVAPLKSRVSDESEVHEERLLRSLAVSDAQVLIEPPSQRGWDLELSDNEGHRTLIEVKARDRAPKLEEIKRIFLQVQERAVNKRDDFQVWYLNTEKLGLTVYQQDNRDLPNFVELNVLDVWEYDQGSERPFTRSDVVRSIQIWKKQIAALYENILSWAAERQYEQAHDRTVIMSEELMQRFAVPDQELPLLDLFESGKPLASFVPAGLWLIGAHGRIDFVTAKDTWALINVSREVEAKWLLMGREGRKSAVEFTQAAFMAVLRHE